MRTLLVFLCLLSPIPCHAQSWRPDIRGHILQADRVIAGHADPGMHPNVLLPIGSLTNRNATPDEWSGDYGVTTLYGTVAGPYFGVNTDRLSTATGLAAWVLLKSDGRQRHVDEVYGVRAFSFVPENTDGLVSVGMAASVRADFPTGAQTNYAFYAPPYHGGQSLFGGTNYVERFQLFDQQTGRWFPVTVGPPNSCGSARCLVAPN